MSNAIFLSLLVTGAITQPTGAQTTTHGGTTFHSSVDRDRLDFDVDAQGTVWVRGRTYKAGFARGSAVYIPFLGSKAPRNFPLDLRVESVTIGGAPLAFDADACAARVGDTIEYDRGAFRERYVLAPDSVEQTFVFEHLEERGEIVVTLAVDTELARGEDANGLRFENELGHVRYGRAFAGDASRPMEPIASRLTQGRIEIVAPKALVESTVGAFVIDPLLTSYSVDGSTVQEFAADTSYDVTNAVWLTVCEETFSATDHDIHAVRHTTSGTVSQGAYINSSPENWRAPAIANNNLANEFLVVAEVGAAPTREIWCRRVGAAVSTPLSTAFVISEPVLGGDKHSPDVGGDASLSGPTDYLVVWEIEVTPGVRHDIHAKLASATGVGSIDILEATASEIYRNPSISNSNGNPASAVRWWNIVYEHQSTPTNRDIRGRRLNHDVSLPTLPFTIGNASADERNPTATADLDVAGSTDPWMVAYEIDAGVDGWDVRCRALDEGTILSTLNLSPLLSVADLDQVTPSCDTADGQFVLAWDERAQVAATTTRIRVATLNSAAGVLGITESGQLVSTGANISLRPKVVAQAASGSGNDDMLVVYDRDTGSSQDIWATGYDVPNGGGVEAFCGGFIHDTLCPCGNQGVVGSGCGSSVNPSGATLGHSGNARVSDDNFQLRADGLPASAPVLFFQGTLPAASGIGVVFGDGLRCVAGTVRRLALRNASAGFVAYPSAIGDPDISVIGAVPAAGGTRFYQVWYRNSASFCTEFTFNLTNGLRAAWIP